MHRDGCEINDGDRQGARRDHRSIGSHGVLQDEGGCGVILTRVCDPNEGDGPVVDLCYRLRSGSVTLHHDIHRRVVFVRTRLLRNWVLRFVHEGAQRASGVASVRHVHPFELSVHTRVLRPVAVAVHLLKLNVVRVCKGRLLEVVRDKVKRVFRKGARVASAQRP